ncbi:MAG TPA: TRAP transporter small permease subunit [Burkholderiaceae bacterium]
MNAIADRLDVVNRWVGSVVRWAALLMMLLQFAIVLLRYVFGVSEIALNEGVLYMHATLFMLAAGYTLQVDGHVRVDIFYAKATPRTRARIDLFGHLLLLMPSVSIILYWSWPTVRSSWAILEGPISVGGIPALFLLKSLIPAFCVLLLLQSLALVLRNLASLASGRH